jgi:tetratricopeptide (TPR) repeat protein
MILLWVALAWAEPQDLDTKALLAEVEARRGLTEPMLTERRDHALRLLETRGLDDDHRERAAALYCDYSERHAAAFGGFGSGTLQKHCPSAPTGEQRRRIVEGQLQDWKAYRGALTYTYAFEFDEALAALPAPSTPADPNSPEAVLTDAIGELRAWLVALDLPTSCTPRTSQMDLELAAVRERSAQDRTAESHYLMKEWNRHNRLQGPSHDLQVARLGVEMGLLLWDTDRELAVPRLEAAASLLGRVTGMRWTDGQMLVDNGRALTLLGRHDEALAAYTTAAALAFGSRTRTQALLRAGDSYAELGDVRRSCQAYALAGEQDRDRRDGHPGPGVRQNRTGR